MKAIIHRMVDSSPEVWRILMVDDDEEDYWITRQMLSSARGRKIELEWASTYQIGQQKLENSRYDAVLVDYDLGALTGIQLIRETAARGYPAPLILYTGRGSYEVDVEAMEAGASLYLTKGESTSLTLERFIRYAIERKRSEEALRFSEERFNRAFSATPNALVISGMTDGRIQVVNDSYERLFGYSRSEVIGRTALELEMYVIPADRAEAIRRLQADGAVRDFEISIRTRTGEIREVSLSIEPIPMDREMYMLTVFEDLTERRQAAEALETSERMLKLFVEYAPAAIAMFDRNMCYIAASRRYLTDYRLGQSDLTGQSHYEVFPEVPERWKEIHQRCLAGASESCDEDPFLRADGQTDWTRWEIHPWYEHSGAVGGLVLFTELITERKQTEEALRYQAALLTNINDAVIASNTNYHLTAWNPAAERLYGWKAEEVLGKVGLDILQTIFPEIERSAMIETINRTGYWRGEVTQVKKDGTRFPLEINTIVMHDEHGQISGYLSLNRDISERKQVEQALGDALTEVVRERNRLLAVMESLPIGMAIYNDQGGVIQSNSAFEDIWGSPRPPADSVDDYDAYQGWWVDNDQRVQPEEWASALAIHDGATVAGQFIRIQRFDGQIAYVINSGAPIRDDQGQVTGCAVAIMDITEQTRLEQAQHEHALQMEIQRNLLEYRAKERQRLARDLHDGPVQDLSSLIFQVQFSKESIENPHIRTEMDAVLNGLKMTVQNLREMISELRPPALIRFGLAKALKIHVEDFHEKHPNITIETDIRNDGDCLSEQVRLNLYRIAQEALLNLVKHAQATSARVMFTCEDNEAVLEIEDNGQGFSISDDLTGYLRQEHYGLAGMRELAEAVGGALEVTSSPGSGTRVHVKMPVL